MLGLSSATQAVVPFVPLQEGFSMSSTGRLQVLMAFTGGHSFKHYSVRQLTLRRADPNTTNTNGVSVLKYAVQKDDAEVVEYLVGLNTVRKNIDNADNIQRTA